MHDDVFVIIAVIHFSISFVANYERNIQKSSEDVPQIRKADLENHNKDGGLWVVIHGRVYDVQDFKSQAPCGSDRLKQYAGRLHVVGDDDLRADFRFVPSEWETALLCNGVSHWLGASLESALDLVLF